MDGQKKWIKTGEGKYSFNIDGQLTGEMQFHYSSGGDASISIGSSGYHIKRTGFWKNTMVVEDAMAQTLVKVYPEKWYSSAWVLEYGPVTYKLVVRNNPLAEWAIQQDGQDILAYGLDPAKQRIGIKISSAEPANDLLLDFILWFLFAPVAMENCGDEYMTSMLFLAQ